jgi:hypothetical protein
LELWPCWVRTNLSKIATSWSTSEGCRSAIICKLPWGACLKGSSSAGKINWTASSISIERPSRSASCWECYRRLTVIASTWPIIYAFAWASRVLFCVMAVASAIR